MEENKEEKIYYLNVEDILPNRFQPRIAFDEKELNDLSNSIIKYGVIQPIVVRRISNKYEIIAGERRYKAACLAGLKTIPAIINNTDDNTSAEIALLENLQRKNLTVIEEAMSFKKLMDKGFTQEELANKLGVSQSSIANKLRLLSLPKEVKDALLYNKISERHARSLLSLNNEDLQKNILNKIIDEKLTVKQTEEEINSIIMQKSKQDRNYIPEDIKRFLTPEEPKEEVKIESNNEIMETLDFETLPVPDVVNISNNESQSNNSFEEIKSDNESINPYQTNEQNDIEIGENIISKENNNIDIENLNNDDKDTSNNIYNEIKKYLNDMSLKNPKISFASIELDGKYQILVDINKY